MYVDSVNSNAIIFTALNWILIMCYVIITSGSLTWFILSLIADMVLLSAIVSPKWLIGPERYTIETNFTSHRYPSVGIYTRCKIMDKSRYHCGPFDFDGFATDNEVYPIPWKASMFFISLGFFILTTTVLLTLLTCCRQSLFGKSIHNITGSAQVVSGVYCLRNGKMMIELNLSLTFQEY